MTRRIPPAAMVRFQDEETRVHSERRKARMKQVRAQRRTPARAKQRDQDNAEIAAYLARVPPQEY